MVKDLKILIPAALIFLLALFGIYRLYQVRVARPQESPSPTPTATPSGFETFPSPPTSVPSTLPASGSDTVEVKNIGITLTSPQIDDLVSSPVKVTGRANVFEGHVSIRVKDANGQILGQGFATACMDIDACPFEASVPFTNSTTLTGEVELYSPSAVDGTEQYLQSVSIRFF